MADGTCSLDECNSPAYCRAWCKKHYDRWHRTGDPLGMRKKANGTIRVALESAARSTADECILLSGYKCRPATNFDGIQMFASRAVWMIANGDPGDAFVLHTCHRGEEGCINIRHLYTGDQAQNIRDMDGAGRGRRGHGIKILDPQDVAEIRRRHVRGINQHYPSNTAELASEFGVSKATITGVVAYRRWGGGDVDNEIRRLTAELGRTEAGEVAAAQAAAPAES